MQRITTPTRVVDKFGPGKDGFTDGNPDIGLSSTQLDAGWHDQEQEEIANAIESSGLALNPLDMTQLWQAINRAVNGGPFVLRAGDTMTGPLFVQGGIDVDGDVNAPGGAGNFQFIRSFGDLTVDLSGSFGAIRSFGDLNVDLTGSFGTIRSFGDIDVNQTARVGTLVATATANISGNSIFNNDLAVLGAFTAPGFPLAIGDTQPYQRGLAAIRQFEPVIFRDTADRERRAPLDGRDHYGLVVEDIRQIMPEMLNETANLDIADGVAVPSVAYQILFFALINAVRELADQVEQLDARVHALEGTASVKPALGGA